MIEQFKKNISKIKILFICLSGVLGQHKVIQNEKNKLFSSDIQDGMGVTLALKSGLKIVVVYENYHPAGLKRAKELKTTKQLKLDENIKYEYFKLLKEFNADEKESAWIASDIEVIKFYKKCGLKIAVPESPEEIKKIAHVITTKPGGKGALREAVEFIIKLQGKWDDVIACYNL